MTEIKCIDNLIRLKEMLSKGEKDDAAYFSAKLDISERTFYRLLNCLKNDDGLIISFDRIAKSYYLETI